MEDYKAELEALGLTPFNKSERIGNLLRMSNSMIKRRRNNATSKANQFGLDPIGSVYAADEPILEGLLEQRNNIENQAYQSQFAEMDFLQNHKLRKLQMEDLEGGWFDDLLGIASLGVDFADVTGLGKKLGKLIG